MGRDADPSRRSRSGGTRSLSGPACRLREHAGPSIAGCLGEDESPLEVGLLSCQPVTTKGFRGIRPHHRAVGAGVGARRVGEAVTALTTSGPYAEVVLAPAALTLGIGSMPLRRAAGLGWGAPTAYDLINTAAHLRPGENVLIHAAAGSVGTLAAQFARL